MRVCAEADSKGTIKSDMDETKSISKEILMLVEQRKMLVGSDFVFTWSLSFSGGHYQVLSEKTDIFSGECLRVPS